MDYKKAGKISEALLISSVVVAFVLSGIAETNLLFYLILIASVLMLVGGIAEKIAFYRCSHGHHLLPFKTLSHPDYAYGHPAYQTGKVVRQCLQKSPALFEMKTAHITNRCHELWAEYEADAKHLHDHRIFRQGRRQRLHLLSERSQGR